MDETQRIWGKTVFTYLDTDLEIIAGAITQLSELMAKGFYLEVKPSVQSESSLLGNVQDQGEENHSLRPFNYIRGP